MAAGDVLYVRGDPVVWRDSGGVAMTLSSLPAGQSRVGARYDFGAAGALPAFYRWFARTQFAVAPTAQTGLEIFFGLWDDESGPADAWGNIASTDTAYSAAADIARREHLTLAGVVHAPTSAVGQTLPPAASRTVTLGRRTRIATLPARDRTVQLGPRTRTTSLPERS